MELKKNPFYTLNVGCDADRNTIHEAADELAFFDEDGSVEEARNALLNPARRLTAEMDWFPGLSKAGIDELRQGLENDAPLLVSSEADALSRLNVSAYNLRFARMTDAALADTIRRLDATAAEAGAGTVLPLILAARSKARMPEVSEDDIARELNRKRGEIRQIVAEKLSTMPRQDYVRLMTTLAETLVGQSERGGVIDDAVDQYEIRMHDELRKRADEIRTRIEAVKACGTYSSNEIDGLIEEVKAWDELAQPIQLKGQSSGRTHEISKELGGELRGLAICLHNEKNATQEAARLAKAMQSVFAELGDLSAAFGKDYDTLQQMSSQKELLGKIEKLKALCEIKDVREAIYFNQKIGKVENAVRALNREILAAEGLKEEERTTLRTFVCAVARESAVQMVNMKRGLGSPELDAAFGAYLLNVLLECFSDLPDMGQKIKTDYTLLMARGSNFYSTASMLCRKRAAEDAAGISTDSSAAGTSGVKTSTSAAGTSGVRTSTSAAGTYGTRTSVSNIGMSGTKTSASGKKKRRIKIAAFVAVAILVTVVWPLFSSYRAKVNGKQKMAEGDYAAAYSFFMNDMFFSREQRPEAAFLAGEDALSKKDYNEAIRFFSLAGTRGEERRIDAMILKAEQLNEAGRRSDALELLEQLPDEPRAQEQANGIHRTTGKEQLLDEKYQEALESYRQCKKDTQAETNASIIEKLLQGDCLEAAREAEEALSRNTTDLGRSDWYAVVEAVIGKNETADINTALSNGTALRILSGSDAFTADSFQAHAPKGSMIGSQMFSSKTAVAVPDLNALYKDCGTDPQGEVLIVAKSSSFLSEGESIAVLLDLMMLLPEELYPNTLDEVEYVVLITYSHQKEGSYMFSSTVPLREYALVTVYGVPSEYRIDESEIIEGDEPPASFTYYGTAPAYKSGGAPNVGKEVYTAITSLLG